MTEPLRVEPTSADNYTRDIDRLTRELIARLDALEGRVTNLED